MKSVSIIIILCSLPAGLGVIIDRLMLNRHKGWLHDALLRYWVLLDELSLPDIWRVFATYAIRFFKRIFGEKIRSLRCIITIIMFSFCLTACALLLGLLLDKDHELSEISVAEWLVALYINLIFDTFTGLVTVKVLSMIQRLKPGKAIALIGIDVILAFLFAIACLFFVRLIKDPYDGVYFLYNLLQSLLIRATFDISFTGYFYASTTFIPTLIYLTILSILIISKAILGIVIRFTKYFLERTTEVEKSKDLAVFTLTGSFFSVIVLLLSAFVKLNQTL